MELSSKYRDCLLWRDNPNWYFYDEERACFKLTAAAPEKARRSFARWLEVLD